MNLKAVRVPRGRAEEIRKRLKDEGALDTRRRIIDRGEVVEIPILRENGLNYPVVRQDAPEYYRRPPTLAQELQGQIPDELLSLLPSGWQFIGPVILVRLDERLYPYRHEVARALRRINPRCETVLLDRGIEGEYREPNVEVLLGDTTEVVHREHGCQFKLDVVRVMWSKGNLDERARMSQVGETERVLDMFAGVGYFTIPMAVHSTPRIIKAVEWNPLAYHYLRENIRLNHVEDRVEAIHGDCAKIAPSGWADRILMGLVGTNDTHEYLDVAVGALREEGVIHYHETVPEHLINTRPPRRVREAANAGGYECRVLGVQRVKKYAPGVWHVVVDAHLH